MRSWCLTAALGAGGFLVAQEPAPAGVPVTWNLLPPEPAPAPGVPVLKRAGVSEVAGQLLPPRWLCFVVTGLEADAEVPAELSWSTPLVPPAPRFTIVNDKAIEIRDRGVPVLRRLHVYDPKDHDATQRCYDQLLAFDGELLTKDAGGQHPHHRGLFLGCNKTRRGDQTVDFWHLKDGSTIRCVEPLVLPEHGDTVALLISKLRWFDKDDKPWVEEQRAVRWWAQPDGRRLFDVVITLAAVGAAVTLEGDPHHAGFQFRADDALSAREKETRFVRPPTAKDQGNDLWTACEWVAVDFTLRGRRHVVQYISAPENPGPWVMSTRGYGRVGAFARCELSPGKTLLLRYRIAVIDPEKRPLDVTPEALQKNHDLFARPPRLVIKS